MMMRYVDLTLLIRWFDLATAVTLFLCQFLTFFFNDPATTEIYTLSLHDALPILSRRNIRRRITIPLTLSNLKLLRRITRTENILHRNFTRRQVAIQNRVASNIGISQSTFSVKVLNLFSRSRRKTNK